MSDFMDRLTKGMATRRGFISTMGKVVAGVAAAMTGGLFNEGLAQAAPLSNLLCCGGTYCGYTHCPSGSSVDYTWCCRYNGDYIGVICHDCCQQGDCKYHYVCTYPTRGGIC